MLKYLVIAPVCILLTACSGVSSDIDSFIKDPGVKAGQIEKLPKIKISPNAKYDRTVLTDPFSIRALSAVKGKNAPDLDRPREVLEKFGLESLQMVGYIIRNNQSFALVKDPEGVVHNVRAGEYMGTNYGKVTSVSKEGVHIIENIADNSGGWSTRDVNLTYGELDPLNTSGLSNNAKSGTPK